MISKIGIGLAYNILGSSYLSTESYNKLYNILWNKQISINDMIYIPFFKKDTTIDEYFSWNGGVVISFHYNDGKIVLLLNVYGHSIGIEVLENSNDEQKKLFQKYLNTIFISIPIIDYEIEVPFIEFFAHKHGIIKNESLAQLEKMRCNYRPFEPHLDE
jgi:hypothetical protein